MESCSVIVTAHNMEAVIVRTLRTVEVAFGVLRERMAQRDTINGEILVVDDGSSDHTWQTVNAFAAGKSCYKLVRQPKPTSPGCARNVGVQASSGTLLFILDGDDLFYANHIVVCLQAMESPGVGFVKTQVHIADPIHAEWFDPISRSIVINLCVRRQCHDAVHGFLNFLLCNREKEQLRVVTDIF